MTLSASIKIEQLADGRKFVVSGEGPVIMSIQRMLAGHAATMNGKDGWTFSVEDSANGASLVVRSPSSDKIAILDGLGFIGVMTVGMHHQEHHWMIAKGMHPH